MARNPIIKPEPAVIRSFLDKIVINAGVGRMSTSQQQFEEKALRQILSDIASFSGQKAQIRRAVKSISGFKLREGQIVGVRVTLRGKRMVDLFERLVTMVLPRVKDFGGVALRAVDHGGCLNIGFREQYVFPEIVSEESILAFPLQVTLVPKRSGREEAIATYRSLGMPFKKEK